MTSFYVGEKPSQPLVVTVTDDAGTPLDLNAYVSVALVGDGLPAGTAATSDAQAGEVSYTFTDPFVTAGPVEFLVRLNTASGGIDYSGPLVLSVLQRPADSRVTLALARLITASDVSSDSLLRAQSQLSLLVDRQLWDDETWDALPERDSSLLRQAIAWQGLHLDQVEQSPMPFVPGATSLSTGDVSVSFGDGATPGAVALSPLARNLLRRLSWHRNEIPAYVPKRSRVPSAQWLADMLNGVRP